MKDQDRTETGIDRSSPLHLDAARAQLLHDPPLDAGIEPIAIGLTEKQAAKHKSRKGAEAGEGDSSAGRQPVIDEVDNQLERRLADRDGNASDREAGPAILHPQQHREHTQAAPTGRGAEWVLAGGGERESLD